MQETRRFDGEIYHLATIYNTKSKAVHSAKAFRTGEQPEKVRVVKCKGRWWCVYTRKK